VTETNGFELSVTVLLRRSSPGERYRRGGLGPVQDARTGSAGAREARLLHRIAIRSPNAPPCAE
jgi:hypothetical protein